MASEKHEILAKINSMSNEIKDQFAKLRKKYNIKDAWEQLQKELPSEQVHKPETTPIPQNKTEGHTKKVCPFSDCINASDCGLLEITGTIPKSFESCSYARTFAQAEKQMKKRTTLVDLKQRRKLRNETKEE